MLALSSTSWIQIEREVITCTTEEFDSMWSECPKTRETMKMYGKTIPIPRYQQLYGETSYSFSGMKLIPNPVIPPLIQRCLDVAKKMYPDGLEWNGALVNFYRDGESYISQHSDDERDLVKDAPILSFSFGEERTFLVQSKTDDAYIKELKVRTKHASLIVMGGRMQSEFTHGIPKMSAREGKGKPRINVTIRVFRRGGEKRQKIEV